MTIVSSLYVHFTFCVKGQKPLLTEDMTDILTDFFALRAKRCKSLLVDSCCMSDHVHLVVKYSPYLSPQEVFDELKNGSAEFINNYKLTSEFFEWTDDEVMICIGYIDLENLRKYFSKQKEYHVVNGKTWKDEILDLLDTNEFPFAEEEWTPLIKL
jgi:REP element-mobilizing transposase RayT